MLFYKSFGNSSNPPLVFLHGFLGSHEDFYPIIEHLQKKYFCLAIDLPAHGKSSYVPNIVEAVQTTIASFSCKPVIIGYSLGGRIALDLSQRSDLTILGTIAISSHIGLSSPDQKAKRLEQDLIWKRRLEKMPVPEFLNLWYEQSVFSSLKQKPKLLQELLEKRHFNNPKELGLVLEKMSLSKQPLLMDFSSPTAFLFGKEDLHYKKLYQTLPKDISKIEIPSAGHTILLENPTLCSTWIDQLTVFFYS